MSRLFLSSTTVDLAEYRAVAIHVCQRLGIEVIAMEDFGPDPRAAAAVCQSKIEQADLFLGLYAHWYGHRPDGFGGASITELEYEWAMQRKPPLQVLLFLVSEDLPWLPTHIDDGDARTRLQQLKTRLKKKHVVSALTTPERFKEDLFVHLPKFRDQALWSAAHAHKIPLPPEPYVAHQYTLLQTNQVIGRKHELQTLDSWVNDPTSEFATARLLCIVSIGGMGKSALTWKWFHQHAPRAATPFAGRFWWSFYESGAGFDRFITSALAYCSGRSPDAISALPAVDREARLLELLDRHPFLLVLDGLERLLSAYSELHFAHIVDEELDTRTASSVASGLTHEAANTLNSEHWRRKTIDPRDGNFLRKLAHVSSARVLVTTRLYPYELETTTRHALPGTARWYMRGLKLEDALSLWRAMEVSGTDVELARLFGTIEHYPLLIRALAGEIAGYRHAPGDFDAWRRAHPQFDPFSLSLVQAKRHVLSHALDNLNMDARELLHTIAAFRAPVEYDTFVALFLTRNAWPPEKLDTVLTELEDRGLVGWDRHRNQYELHPIVRGVVWREMDEVKRREVYSTLEQHFSAISQAAKRVRTFPDALPLIELFTALVGLGRHEEAATLYFQRLHNDFPFVQSGMEHERISMLESLFPDGLDRPPKSLGWTPTIYAQLGLAYANTGRLTEAHSFFIRQLTADAMDFSPIAHQNAVYSSRALGRLLEALQHAKAALAKSELSALSRYMACLAQCEAVIGEIDNAKRRLGVLMRDDSFDPADPQIQLWTSAYEEAAEIAERKGLKIATAEAWMNLGRYDDVVPLLLDALREARAKTLVEPELEGLRVLAECHRRRGDLAQSRTYLDDLAGPAARGPYRLIQADAANVLAELERDCGNQAAAIAAAQDAYRLAWCDGPPYAYHWALEHAKRLLREFGAPFPDPR